MIDMEDIEQTIDELEHSRYTTFRVCERLAILYAVRDHFNPKRIEAQGVQLEGSDFLELAGRVDYPNLMAVMDDHMQNLKVVQPKAYDTIMRKLQDLL